MTGWWKGVLLLLALAAFTWALASFLDSMNIKDPAQETVKW